jgi:glycyl-tRNA synthetase beta chain
LFVQGRSGLRAWSAASSELQASAGGYYVCASAPDTVADAIRDHYKPQGLADTVPTAPLTVAVALADKLDIPGRGFFAIDGEAHGLKGPVRAEARAALGVIRRCWRTRFKMSLAWIDYAAIA